MCFLLRCWSIWRVQQGGGRWLNDERYPYRRREFARQLRDLHSDLLEYHRALPPGAPFLNNAAAAALASKRAPTLVKDITTATGSPGATGGSGATGSSGATRGSGAAALG